MIKKFLLKGFVIIFFFVFGFMIALFTYGKVLESQKEKLHDVLIYDMRNTLEKKDLDVSFYDLKKGDTLNLSKEKKVVFLNFWATWCQPCIAEMPSMTKLKTHFLNKDISFIIASDEKLEVQRKFLKKRNFTLDFYSYSKLTNPFQGNSLPRTYILHKGKIYFSHVGAFNSFDKSTIDLINKLLVE